MLAISAMGLAACGQTLAATPGTHPAGATSSTTTTSTLPPPPPGLPPPTALVPLASPPLAGEGQWTAAGRSVSGSPVLYITTLRAPGSDTPAGIAWMDTSRLRGTLYSGSISPGQGPWTYTAPVSPAAALTLVCAFNGGFKLADTHGGYYAEGRYFAPLVDGAASLVITQDGTVTVGQWGRDELMAANVVAVRQNLTLLVDQGAPVPGLSASDTAVWGSTLNYVPQVYRSGVGETAGGALVYVSGPSLDIVQLAALLVAAGAVRGMELDINPAWDTFAFYTPPTPSGAAAPANGTELLASMSGGPSRFFDPSWARDFITMSTR
ncbi:MAG TPA: hypothetical protein VGG43_10470 [Acidimicrobiales bacterium]|jgi:hypothetical protein